MVRNHALRMEGAVKQAPTNIVEAYGLRWLKIATVGEDASGTLMLAVLEGSKMPTPVQLIHVKRKGEA
jgi:hypothetical protein